MQHKDHYKTLGVAKTASQDEISKAYRNLARQYHPDINKAPGSEEKLKEINEAHEVLGDTEKRQQYDTFGGSCRSGQGFRQPRGWGPEDFGGGAWQQQGQPHFDTGGGGGGFNSIFESLFGGAGGGPTAASSSEKGQNYESAISIPLEDAYRGATRGVTLSIPSTAGGPPQQKTFQVKIPAGITNGGKIRLGGQGAPGRRGPGDLIITVKIVSHPLYRVKGHNLETDLLVSPWEAALGGKIQIPSLDGNVTMTLPAGTQGGARMRLRGKGLPKRNSKESGDLFAVIRIAVPKKLSAKERELFKELARQSSFKPRAEK